MSCLVRVLRKGFMRVFMRYRVLVILYEESWFAVGGFTRGKAEFLAFMSPTKLSAHVSTQGYAHVH